MPMMHHVWLPVLALVLATEPALSARVDDIEAGREVEKEIDRIEKVMSAEDAHRDATPILKKERFASLLETSSSCHDSNSLLAVSDATDGKLRADIAKSEAAAVLRDQVQKSKQALYASRDAATLARAKKNAAPVVSLLQMSDGADDVPDMSFDLHSEGDAAFIHHPDSTRFDGKQVLSTFAKAAEAAVAAFGITIDAAGPDAGTVSSPTSFIGGLTEEGEVVGPGDEQNVEAAFALMPEVTSKTIARRQEAAGGAPTELAKTSMDSKVAVDDGCAIANTAADAEADIEKLWKVA